MDRISILLFELLLILINVEFIFLILVNLVVWFFGLFSISLNIFGFGSKVLLFIIYIRYFFCFLFVII